MADGFRLRPWQVQDEITAFEAQQILEPEDPSLLQHYFSGMSWADYLRCLRDYSLGVNLIRDQVPETTLVAVAAGHIVGRVSIRHHLNSWLNLFSGHIGYVVVPPYRRLGYATEMLRNSLIIARAIGVSDVLVCCADHNEASAKVIEKNGGVLESVVRHPDEQLLVRRYWIS